jgi:hypothetical protein
VTWTVQGRPTVSNAALTVAAAKPQLTLTVVSGKDEPALRSVELKLPAGLRLARVPVGIQIHSSTNAKLHFSHSDHGNVLKLTLARPSTSFKVSLGSSALVAATNIQADAQRAAPSSLKLSLTTVDSAAATSIISTNVLPRT